MKKLLLITIIALTVGYVNAQNFYPFPASNAHWEEYFQGNSGSFPYGYLLFNEDTTIGSMIYHKLFRYSLFQDTTYIGAIVQNSNKQVFFRDSISNYDFLLYDFSLGINDTLFYPDTMIGNYEYRYDYVVVTNIDSVFDGINYRKRFHLGDTWFDGIGSINGLLFPIMPIYTCYCDWDLVCFFHGGTLLFCPNDIDDISENANNKSNIFVIIPNPATNNLTIETPQKSTFEIINLQGQIIKTLQTTDDKTQVDVSALAGGVYIIKLNTGEGSVVRKFIKE